MIDAPYAGDPGNALPLTPIGGPGTTTFTDTPNNGRTGAQRDVWLEYEHPGYVALRPQWVYATDHYTGRVVNEAKISGYLIKRSQGESDKSYRERCNLADYTPHFGTLVDTLAGMLFAAEGKATRNWQDPETKAGLGDPEDPTSPAARLIRDADGKGTGWQTMWRNVAIELIVNHCLWMMVDAEDGKPVLKWLRATAVPNWLEGRHGPEEVVVLEVEDVRGSLKDKPGSTKQYLVLTAAGWQRYQVTEAGDVVEVLEPGYGQGTFTYLDRDGRSTLPIFAVELPLNRHVGYLLARKANAIFNQESARDHILRVANFPRLNVFGTEAQLERLKVALAAGENTLENDPIAGKGHAYIAPDSGPANVATEVLKRKVEELWITGFKMYGDSAREKTATEVSQDVAAGVGAFLQLLKTALDDAENHAFYLLEQAEYSLDKTRWGGAMVERSDDFAPFDPEATLDRMRTRYFGTTGVIPVGRSALIEAAKQAAQYDGLPVDEAEIAAAVDAQLLGDVIDKLDTLDVTPGMVKARLALRLIASTGIVSAEETVKIGDQEDKKLIDILLTEAEGLAQAAEDNKRRMAELGPFSPAPEPGQQPGGAKPPFPPAKE
jgi:hypothetical protein